MWELGWGWSQTWDESSQGWVDGAMVGVKEAKWDHGQGRQDQGRGDTARVSMTAPEIKRPGSGRTGPGSDGWAQDEAEHQRWTSSASALCLGAKGRLAVLLGTKAARDID